MATQLKIRLYGDPCLRQKAEEVKEVGPGERMLAQAMIDTMYAQKGIGLAAPQVGISQRLFVMDVGDGPIAVFNPEVLKTDKWADMEEGCLSIPEVTVDIERPYKIHVRYTDANGACVEQSFKDLMARVFQHESDHLDGVLIVDYADEPTLKKFQKKLEELSAQTKGDV